MSGARRNPVNQILYYSRVTDVKSKIELSSACRNVVKIQILHQTANQYCPNYIMNLGAVICALSLMLLFLDIIEIHTEWGMMSCANRCT